MGDKGSTEEEEEDKGFTYEGGDKGSTEEEGGKGSTEEKGGDKGSTKAEGDKGSTEEKEATTRGFGGGEGVVGTVDVMFSVKSSPNAG